MDYGQLFLQSLRFTWQHKHLWLLSATAVLGGVLLKTALQFFVSGRAPMSPQAWADLLQAPLSNQLFLASLAALFTFLFLILWVFALVAEAGIIQAVAAHRQGKRLSLAGTWRAGWSLLMRFVAVDGIVFIPLFILSLLVIVVAMAFVVGGIFAVQGGAALNHVLLVGLVVSLVCLIPLSLILPPALLMTNLVRLLTFRAIALRYYGVWASIRNTVPLLRQYPGTLILSAAFLWLIHFLSNQVVNLLVLPLAMLLPVDAPSIDGVLDQQIAPASLSAWLVAFAMVFVRLLPRAVVYTFIASAWTFIYGDLHLSQRALHSVE